MTDSIAKNQAQKRKISIAKPLVYDIGWVVMDRQGNIQKRENYLVQETFFVPQVFNTAYYKEKRSLYMKMLQERTIQVANWDNIVNRLLLDLQAVDLTAAYNALFDFKKAIPFTEEYIDNLYSCNYTEWEKRQYQSCKGIISGKKKEGEGNAEYMQGCFKLRGEIFPLVDLWGLCCEKLINTDRYKRYCLKNELITDSGLYFKTSAETAFQYLQKEYSFIEDHTALRDAEIEAVILAKALKKNKVEPGIRAFPFQQLGKISDFVLKRKKVL